MSYLIGIGIGIVGVLCVQWLFGVALQISLARNELARYRRADEFHEDYVPLDEDADRRRQEAEDRMVDRDWAEVVDLASKAMADPSNQ